MAAVVIFLYNLVNALFDVYEILIIVWCILSWFPNLPKGPLDTIALTINSIVAPYINLFRRFIPPLAGIDFSPIIAILVLSAIQYIVLNVLFWPIFGLLL